MQIFIHKDGQQQGPFDRSMLEAEIAAGRITRVDLAWHEGLESWKPAGELLNNGGPPVRNDLSAPPPARPKARAQPRSALDAGHGEAFGMEDAGDLGVHRAVSATVTEFKSLDYGFLLPFRKIFSTSLLKKKAVRWVLLFGLLPIFIFILTIQMELDFLQVVWLLQIYFCLFWALYFYSLIRPSGAIWKRAIGYACFTVLIGMPFIVIVGGLPIFRTLLEGTATDNTLPRVLGFILGVGPLEELCKALPLLIFGLRKGRIHGTRDGLFLGLMSGLGFAASEGVAYTLGATHGLAENLTWGSLTGQMLQMYFRMMSSPVLHGAWAGIVGWFIGVAATRKGSRWPIVAVGVAFAALLHGLNNVAAGGWLHLVVAGFSIMVFMSYLVHGEEETLATEEAGTSDAINPLTSGLNIAPASPIIQRSQPRFRGLMAVLVGAFLVVLVLIFTKQFGGNIPHQRGTKTGAASYESTHSGYSEKEVEEALREARRLNLMK